jgi:hypothetical protein
VHSVPADTARLAVGASLPVRLHGEADDAPIY